MCGDDDGGPPPRSNRSLDFARWLASNVTSVAPQSMAPIVFGVATLNLTPGMNTSAAMVAAMTFAQVLGAWPVTVAGRQFRVDSFLRTLVGFRAAMFCVLGLAIILATSALALICLAALTGLVNGAVFGLLRATLNGLVTVTVLHRALGIAATANELVAVAGPVAASLISARSISAALITMILTSALPLITLPRLPAVEVKAHHRGAHERFLSIDVLVWLGCAMSGTTAVGAVEIGAVALAVEYGLNVTWAIAFTVPLCVFSVAGGVWASVRNRMPGTPFITLMLLSTATGAAFVFAGTTVWLAIAGTVLVGFWLAPLGMLYSLKLDGLLPIGRRPEGFALLRSAQAVGMICSGVLLAIAGVKPTFATSIVLILLAASVVLILGRSEDGHRSRQE